MKSTVFVHTNQKQLIGAKLSAYSFKRASADPDAFDVRFIELEKNPPLYDRQGQTYLRNCGELVWDNDDLQSFTPTRFLAPQLSGFEGRCLVVDPDVFAIADVNELLVMDMEGKAIRCRTITPTDGRAPYYASSVMLLDCEKLSHWRWDELMERLFNKSLDYRDLMNLYMEDPATIGPIDDGWNHFDTLESTTKLIHFTGRITQPWKSGLPIDFTSHKKPKPSTGPPPVRGFIPRSWVPPRHPRRWGAWGKAKIKAGAKKVLRRAPASRPTAEPACYRVHPDPRQREWFFSLAKECLEVGVLTESFLRGEIDRRHVRADLLEKLAEVSVSKPARKVPIPECVLTC